MSLSVPLEISEEALPRVSRSPWNTVRLTSVSLRLSIFVRDSKDPFNSVRSLLREQRKRELPA